MDPPTNEEEKAVLIATHVILVTMHALHNMMTTAVTYMIQNGLKDKVSYNMIDKIPKQIEELDRMLRECETSCINNLRMNRHTFRVLCDLVREKERKVISMTKPIIEEAITHLYCNIFPKTESKTLTVADLGCASGPNTLLVVSEIIKAVDKLRLKLGHDQSPDFQIYLNDLPGNDFNTLFRSLPKFQENLKQEMGSGLGTCFFNDVPGSFYGRLFASKSLHFVHSSYCLQWLSQVPKGIENNKRNIYMSSTSPPSVLRAYYEQFQRDFSMFLKSRSPEMVDGGRMVLTILGRKSDDPFSKECCYIRGLLAAALNQMITEGIIEEEKLDSFNIPNYTPSPKEVKFEVEKEGSFVIDRLDVSEVNWNGSDDGFINDSNSLDGELVGYNMAKCMRAVAEPILVNHFGESIMEEVFRRYRKNITDSMSREKTSFINVTVSMTKKAV